MFINTDLVPHDQYPDPSLAGPTGSTVSWLWGSRTQLLMQLTGVMGSCTFASIIPMQVILAVYLMEHSNVFVFAYTCV